MPDKRPVNLDMTTISLPLPALVSILTRISGVFLFVSMPFFIYLLDASLASEASFSSLLVLLASTPVKLFAWVLLSMLIYHAVAGIRHLLADLGLGETLQSGLMGARITILVTLLGMALAGAWLW